MIGITGPTGVLKKPFEVVSQRLESKILLFHDQQTFNMWKGAGRWQLAGEGIGSLSEIFFLSRQRLKLRRMAVSSYIFHDL
jgi:hypothetical protein